MNSAIRLRQDPTPFLSPRQLARHERIDDALERNPRALDSVGAMPDEKNWAPHLNALERALAG